MEWVASTPHTTSERGFPALLPLMRTTRLPVVERNDVPADLNGLVRFAERRNVISARVSSHFNWPVPLITVLTLFGSSSVRRCLLDVVEQIGV